jgi:hypothetical protein
MAITLQQHLFKKLYDGMLLTLPLFQVTEDSHNKKTMDKHDTLNFMYIHLHV